MPNDGRLDLEITDVYGEAVPEKVDVSLRHLELSEHYEVTGHESSRPLSFVGLSRAPRGLYRLQVLSDSFQSVGMVVNIPPSGPASRLVRLPVRSDRVARVAFPPYSDLRPDAKRLITEPAYTTLDPLPKAGLLNLVAKAHRTQFDDGRTVLSFLDMLQEVRGDRLFATVDPALHEEAAGHSDLFHPASDALHTPPPGFEPVDSFKTGERYGNLQLTFSRRGAEWRADMDIDDAQGFEHLFQVLGHIGGATHPFDIHEILVAYQELDPGYRLTVSQPAVAGSARAAQ